MLPINYSTLTSVFKRNELQNCVLNSDIVASIILLHTGADFQHLTNPDLLNDALDKQLKFLQSKLAKLEQDQLWKLIETYQLSDLTMAYMDFKKRGVKFSEDSENLKIINYDKTLIDFKGRYLRNDPEQLRFMSKLKDIEHYDRLNVNGIAGSGKTVILYNTVDFFVNRFPTAKFTWLSNSLNLIAQVKRKYADHDNLTADTFTNYIEQLIDPQQKWGEKYLRLSDDLTLIKLIGIVAENEYQARYDLRMVRYTVDNYCRSSSFTIDVKMVPRNVDTNDETETSIKRKAILEYAKKYWNLLIKVKEKSVGVQKNHHIKYIQKNVDKIISPPLDYLLIDEAQDVTPSIMYIIKCLTGQYVNCRRHQAQAIMLGDRYQSVNTVNEWSYQLKRSNKDNFKLHSDSSVIFVNNSQRQGGEMIQNMVSSSIQSCNEEIDFNAINPQLTNIIELPWTDLISSTIVKTEKTLFIVEDVWILFILAQKFIKEGIPIYAPIDTLEEIRTVIGSALHFYLTGEVTHNMFLGWKNWDDYVAYHARDHFLMTRIDDMFKKGFTNKHLNESLSQLSFSVNKHILSLMAYAKGMECENVYVLAGNEKYNALCGSGSLEESESHALYVALTRATKNLYLPVLQNSTS